MSLQSFSIDKPGVLSDVLLAEVSEAWCRETVALAPSSIDLPVGTVLARTADGSYVPYLHTPEANKAVAVLITPIKSSDVNASGVVVCRGCVLSHAGLFFIPEGAAAEPKKAALEQLYALGLITKENQ